MARTLAQQGIEKARSQLAEARRELHDLKVSLKFEIMHTHWHQFLIKANAVQNTLEKVAKLTPAGGYWWRTFKLERKADPLLNYMFQARHAAEHGLADLLAPGPNPRGLRKAPDCGYIWTSDHSAHGAFAVDLNERGESFRRRVSPPDAKLLPVYNDKWNQTFDPPTQHFGRPLRKLTPLMAGELWLAHITSLVDDAEAQFSGRGQQTSP